MERTRAARCRLVLERHRIRGRKAVLAGVSSQSRRRLRKGRRLFFDQRAGRPMKPIDLDQLQQYSDALRSRAGDLLSVRFVRPRDAAALQDYFRSLSPRSRYNRLMGAASELPPAQLEKFIHAGEDGSFSVAVTLESGGTERIVAEARYAFDPA